MSSTRFEILDTPISGLNVLQRKPIGDSRGYLERLFCLDELQFLTSGKHIAQINHTLTARRGSVRGMHFQHPPHAEIKFVSCLKGEVFDVAVNMRHNSPTFCIGMLNCSVRTTTRPSLSRRALPTDSKPLLIIVKCCISILLLITPAPKAG